MSAFLRVSKNYFSGLAFFTKAFSEISKMVRFYNLSSVAIFIIFSALYNCCYENVNAVSVEEDLTLTLKEKTALDKVRIVLSI